MPSKKRVVYPIQLDPELDAKITLAAEKLTLPKAEVMRLAMAIGLEHLRRINFDLAKHLCQTPEPASNLSLVADQANPSAPTSKGRTRYPAK